MLGPDAVGPCIRAEILKLRALFWRQAPGLQFIAPLQCAAGAVRIFEMCRKVDEKSDSVERLRYRKTFNAFARHQAAKSALGIRTHETKVARKSQRKQWRATVLHLRLPNGAKPLIELIARMLRELSNGPQRLGRGLNQGHTQGLIDFGGHKRMRELVAV